MGGNKDTTNWTPLEASARIQTRHWEGVNFFKPLSPSSSLIFVRVYNMVSKHCMYIISLDPHNNNSAIFMPILQMAKVGKRLALTK